MLRPHRRRLSASEIRENPVGSVISVNPFRCRMWRLHDRLEDLVDEISCRDEIASFEQHGQRIPALGRAITGESGVDVELIYGARRLFVARHLNRSLLVEMRALSDREAAVAMDIENRQRKDLSPYERGQSYSRYLRSGIFSTQEDIARALNVSASQVSRLLKLVKLPTIVIEAFGNPVNICEGWGLELVAALEKPSRQSIIQKAREILVTDPRLPPREVYRLLMNAASSSRKVTYPGPDDVVRGPDGGLVFRIRRTKKVVALILPADSISSVAMKEIRSALCSILHKGRVGTAGRGRRSNLAQGSSPSPHVQHSRLASADLPYV